MLLTFESMKTPLFESNQCCRFVSISWSEIWSIRTSLSSNPCISKAFESIKSKRRNSSDDSINSAKNVDRLEECAPRQPTSACLDRFESIDSNWSIRTERKVQETLIRIDDISRSTSPNAMKFSQELVYMLKNVHAKFCLDWMNSWSIRTYFESIPKWAQIPWGWARGPPHVPEVVSLNLGEISASYICK